MLKKIAYNLRLLIRRTSDFLKWDGYHTRSWAQEGEDLILRRIFEQKANGFYIDVGAHHPMRFSNTYLFYRRGWTGINIDSMPGSMKVFNRFRPRDINLELGIAREAGSLPFYVFNETALNSFSKDLSIERDAEYSQYRIEKVINVQVKPLEKVLDRYEREFDQIDFMTIDVEGLDLEVLKSNNWKKYRPHLVLAEAIGSSLEEIENSEIGTFLRSIGYEIFAKCLNTIFFRDLKKAGPVND